MWGGHTTAGRNQNCAGEIPANRQADLPIGPHGGKFVAAREEGNE